MLPSRIIKIQKLSSAVLQVQPEANSLGLRMVSYHFLFYVSKSQVDFYFAVSISQEKENQVNAHVKKDSKHEIKTPRKNLDFTTTEDASSNIICLTS